MCKKLWNRLLNYFVRQLSRSREGRAVNPRARGQLIRRILRGGGQRVAILQHHHRHCSGDALCGRGIGRHGVGFFVHGAILRSHLRDPGITEEERVLWLRWLLNEFGRRRFPGEKHLFVKFVESPGNGLTSLISDWKPGVWSSWGRRLAGTPFHQLAPTRFAGLDEAQAMIKLNSAEALEHAQTEREAGGGGFG